LQKLDDLLTQATKLAKSPEKGDLSAKLRASVEALREPLDQAARLAAAYLKKHPSPPAAPPRLLHERLDKAARLIGKLPQEGVPFATEEELRKLHPLLSAGGLPAAKDAEALLAALHKLEPPVERARLLAAARSPQALAALDAERAVADLVAKDSLTKLDTAKQALERRSVVAPVAGQVVALDVKAGDALEAGARVATRIGVLAVANDVRVSFLVSQKTALLFREMLRQGQIKAKSLSEVPARLSLNAGEDFTAAGTLEFIDNKADPKSKTVRFHAVFPDSDGALAKKLVDAKQRMEAKILKGAKKRADESELAVRLSVGKPRSVLLVPGTVIGTEPDGSRFALLVNEENKVVKRPVTLGSRIGSLEVVEGLQPGDWIVIGSEHIKGLQAGAKLTPADFVTDFNLLRLQPGTLVDVLRVELPKGK
jgi:multidrug efflux pump subunit AcrA (membrane-fusion protein)